MSGLARATADLHVSLKLTVTTARADDGRGIEWCAVLDGEDFLDGPWRRITHGEARNTRAAFRAAMRANRGRRRRWWR